MDDRRCVVACVLAGERWVRDDRCAQSVVWMKIGASHAFIHHLIERERGIPAHVHSDFDEHDDDAGVLTNRTMTLGTHARVGQDLSNGIFCCCRLFEFVCPA